VRADAERAGDVVCELGGAQAREEGVGLQPGDEAGVLGGGSRLGGYGGVEGAEVVEDIVEGRRGGGAG
jgi:hypothetical protein